MLLKMQCVPKGRALANKQNLQPEPVEASIWKNASAGKR
jgi:hypothetical protein